MAGLGDGSLGGGVHTAGAAVYFSAAHALEAPPRERLSTVYFPGGKITMLPQDAVDRATLAAGRRVAAASLYLTLDPASLEVRGHESRLEWIRVADNLRLGDLDRRLNQDSVAAGKVEGPHGEELLILWKLARSLKVLRGAGEEKSERPDYTFRVDAGRVSIEPRQRVTPVV